MIPEFVFPPTAIMTLCPAQSSYLLSVAMSYLCYYTKPPKDRKHATQGSMSTEILSA